MNKNFHKSILGPAHRKYTGIHMLPLFKFHI